MKSFYFRRSLIRQYKIKYVASISNDSRKLGENGEYPEVDNSVGSLESDKIVLKTSND